MSALAVEDGPVIGSLFSGYGGLEQGIVEVLGGRVAWHVEWDEAPSKVLAFHHPGVPNYGDVTTAPWATMAPVDVLCGGFPCQDLSGAGKQLGLRPGTRSGMWHHFAYAINVLHPGMVVIENVRGLLTSRGAAPTDELEKAWAARDLAGQLATHIEARIRLARSKGHTDHARLLTARRGRVLGLRKRAVGRARRADARIVRALGTVLGDLARLGYDARWCGLRAAEVGAPHNRFRVFIVAVRRPGDTAQDADGAARGERRLAAPRQENSRGTWGDVGRRSGAPAADAERGARGGRADVEVGGPEGRAAARVGAAADADRDGLRSLGNGLEHHPDRRDGAEPAPVEWGPYAAAVARWDAVLGRPAPSPHELGPKGAPRLSPVFVEWMMGLDPGHVTGVPGITRNEALKMLGNGVCPQQAAAALRFLLS